MRKSQILLSSLQFASLQFASLQFASLLFASLFGAGAAIAGPLLQVNVNTSSIAGITGSIDFQFNPGPLVTQAATVQILSFTGGTFGGARQTFGSVSGGPVPGAITINNTSADNEEFESFVFGNSLSFLLSFSGPAVTSPNGTATSTSRFLFSLFSNAAGTIPVLTPDPDGIAGIVTVNLNGTLSPSAVSPQLAFVPEPASWVLMLGGFAGVWGMRRLRLRGI